MIVAYVKTVNHVFVAYMLLYVDDILITSKDKYVINDIKLDLGIESEMKKLSPTK